MTASFTVNLSENVVADRALITLSSYYVRKKKRFVFLLIIISYVGPVL